MKSIDQMETVQIELTSACVLSCSNCTRFCGHHKQNFFLAEDEFKRAIDSLVEFPKMVGFMGGEPLLHPKFEAYCDYALEKIGKRRLGLWSTFPEKFKHYREVICRTFDHVFLNDHSRDDIPHGPVLVGIEEHVKDDADLYRIVDRCWLQNSWSAAINPKGAFFCEVAASMAYLFDGPEGWPVESGWWKRTPKDYGPQIEQWCRRCGCSLPLKRRMSSDGRDDISPVNLQRLQGISRKVDNGRYVTSTFEMDPALANEMYPQQVYKDMEYRGRIAARYGIFLQLNDSKYLRPLLGNDVKPRPCIWAQCRERFGGI